MEGFERKPSRKKYGWWVLTAILCLLIISTLRNVYYAWQDNSPKPDAYLPAKPIGSEHNIAPDNSTKPSWNEAHLDELYQCYALGSCQKCTEKELATDPLCQQTGYKEPIQCSSTNPDIQESIEELPTFRSCSRTKYHEKVRFFKFVGFIIFMSVSSGSLLVWRRKRIQIEQYRRLMRRIENA